jgi:UDP:flavonoid glycosyltransferase YjiC (YdhE family)
MRLLISVTPAFGHLLPVVPLARKALARGHRVAILTSGGMAETLAREVPGAEHLPAGAMPPEFAAAAAARTGKDVMNPTPDVIGEIFGGVRLESASDEASRSAEHWGPDLVVAEAFDTVGPALAAALGVPWHRAGLGPALPDPITAAIAGAAAWWYRERGLRPVPPRTYLDPCPPLMQTPHWHSDVPRIPVRPEPHSTPSSPWTPPARSPGRPRVLVTLGTVFSDRVVLEEVVRAVASTGASVIATAGMTLRAEPGPSILSTSYGSSVDLVQFVPMEQLLVGTDLVVSAGGSGTVLAAMSRGIPMVLWPQGADQPINAARAQAAGVASLVGTAAELPGAVTATLRSETMREAAVSAAQQIAELPTVDEALTEIIELSPTSSR